MNGKRPKPDNHAQAGGGWAAGGGDVPRLMVESHPEGATPDLAGLRRLSAAALPLCLRAALVDSSLTALEEVEVAVVDDATIGRVHGEYLDDPSVTDVITFDHGEIIISRETAAREAEGRGVPVLREMLLYVVHGLLHLGGHDDRSPEDRRHMSALQERILDQVWAGD